MKRPFREMPAHGMAAINRIAGRKTTPPLPISGIVSILKINLYNNLASWICFRLGES